MSRILIILIVVILTALTVAAQGSTAYRVRSGSAVPSGSCNHGPPVTDVYYRTTTNIEYWCTATNTWSPTSSGGITNSAGVNVIPKSDGTNIIASLLNDNGTTLNYTGGTGIFAGASTAIGFTASTKLLDSGDGILRLSNAATSGFTRLQFGTAGATSPALKKNGTQLQVRLADDSADAPLSAASGTFSGTLTVGDGTIAGETVLSELAVNGTEYFSWLGQDSRSTTLRARIPSADPTAGQVMAFGVPSSDISTITWVTPGTGSVTSIATTSPITGGTITTAGTIACATCVTSAAALTASNLVIGGGSQATAVLGSLGTTTTVLHGNAAGAPTFGAVVNADVTSIDAATKLTGITPIANGGTALSALGTALQQLRVNAGATALEYFTPASSGLTVGTTAITSGTGTRLLYETSGNVLGEISGATSNGTVLTLVAPVLGVAAATSLAVTGTAGAGFTEHPTQSSPPSAPATGYRDYADSTGRRAWIRASDGFTRTWDATLTANRVYTLKDATGTIPLLETNNIFTANGALSSGNGPAALLNGTWITGGSATTTKPYVLIEPTGTTSTGWSTAGTGLGVNAVSGFTGNVLDVQLAGASIFKVSNVAVSINTGTNLLTLGDISAGSAKYIYWTSRAALNSPADNILMISNQAANDFGRLQFGGTTSSFPALKRSGTLLIHRLADDSADGPTQASAFVGGGAIPAVSSGTIGTGSKNTAGFITSATTGTYTGVLTFSGFTATTGWSCSITNGTTANIMQQSASATTTATFTGTTVTGDVLRYTCFPY